jgi:hypothetical protein
MRQSKAVNMLCAMPVDLRRWIEDQARLDRAPMNSVIIRCIRLARDAEQERQRERAG